MQLQVIPKPLAPIPKSLAKTVEATANKAKKLPVLFYTFATRYRLDAEISKAQFWWDRLLR